MTVEDVQRRVEDIRQQSVGPFNGNPYADEWGAHFAEDELYIDVLRAIARNAQFGKAAELADAALKARDLPFSRYYT